MMSRTLIALFLASLYSTVSTAKTKATGDSPSCSVLYRVVQEDKLGNFQEGVTGNLKWVAKHLAKKYPGICYEPTKQELAKLPSEPEFEVVDGRPDEIREVILFISVIPATYHGTKVITESERVPTSGTISDNSGGEIGTYEGTTESTSSTAVPYSFEYGQYTLLVESIRADGSATLRHLFTQDGLYRTMYGVPLGGRGRHPVKALVEDAVKWLHAGGLDDASQGVLKH